MATQLSERREFEAGPWVGVCGKCGGWLHEHAPIQPEHPAPCEDRYCVECWADLTAQMVADEGEAEGLRVCESCDGRGIYRRGNDPWAWSHCFFCDGKGYIEHTGSGAVQAAAAGIGQASHRSHRLEMGNATATAVPDPVD